jgi:2-oxo-4-hydroxy-4-carboxy-5-ureidoimidazoline decarboxylase
VWIVTKVSLNWLNSIERAKFVSALANIFEHSAWIADRAADQRPFESLADLHASLMSAAAAMSPEQALSLIKSHPDLANKAQRAAGLTMESTSEQDGAGLDRLSDAEFVAFEELNEAYKTKFGFPFIVCVKRLTKDAILGTFRTRLNNDPNLERQNALSEIKRIASLRLAQLVEASDALPIHGTLSTHVLDTRDGVPARGVAIELTELARQGENRTIATSVTNDDGRTDVPLICGRPLPIGIYELRFHIGAYFERRNVALSEPGFLDVIPIRFGVSNPEGHIHVPLLVSPWSYTTYRGS